MLTQVYRVTGTGTGCESDAGGLQGKKYNGFLE